MFCSLPSLCYGDSNCCLFACNWAFFNSLPSLCCGDSNFCLLQIEVQIELASEVSPPFAIWRLQLVACLLAIDFLCCGDSSCRLLASNASVVSPLPLLWRLWAFFNSLPSPCCGNSNCCLLASNRACYSSEAGWFFTEEVSVTVTIAKREREIQSTKKILGLAVIQTQNLLYTSQMFLPLYSHWAHSKGTAHKPHIAAPCG